MLIGSETSPTEGDRLLLHVRAIAGPRLVGSRGKAWFLVLEVRAREMTVVCETQTLRRLGRNALTVAGYDPRTRSLPHWHTCDDLPEVVSSAAWARAREFLEELLRTMDKLT